MKSIPPRLLVVALGLTLAIAACSSDNSGGDDDGPPSITTTATDFSFVPDAWVVPSGTDIALTFANEGSVVHSFVILNTTIENEDEFSEDQTIWASEIESGTAIQEVIDVTLEPGTYQVICTVETHFDLGMEGELLVSG